MFALNHCAHPFLQAQFACAIPLSPFSHSQPMATLWICMKSPAWTVAALLLLLLLLQQHTHYTVLIRFLAVIILAVCWYSIAKGWRSARSRKLPSSCKKMFLIDRRCYSDRALESDGAGDGERLSPWEIKWRQEGTQIMHESEQKITYKDMWAMCLEMERQRRDKRDSYE